MHEGSDDAPVKFWFLTRDWGIINQPGPKPGNRSSTLIFCPFWSFELNFCSIFAWVERKIASKQKLLLPSHDMSIVCILAPSKCRTIEIQKGALLRSSFLFELRHQRHHNNNCWRHTLCNKKRYCCAIAHKSRLETWNFWPFSKVFGD